MLARNLVSLCLFLPLCLLAHERENDQYQSSHKGSLEMKNKCSVDLTVAMPRRAARIPIVGDFRDLPRFIASGITLFS